MTTTTMVNSRPSSYENAPKPRRRRWTHSNTSAGLSTSCSSRRLPLRGPTMPSQPSPSPSNCEVIWLLLEALNAHQAATKRPISPENDIQNLEQLGTLGYILTLLKEVEPTPPLPPESTLTLQQRVERIQACYGLKECPQDKRPSPTTSKALIEPQNYDQPSTNHTNLGLDELHIGALFFTSRVFGHLFHKLPLGMGGEELSRSSLISLSMKAKYEWELMSLEHTYDSIPSKGPGRGGNNGVTSLCRLQDVLNRLCCKVNGLRAIGLDTYE
ncbi:hypothetical protein NCS52_01593300 [Fusarium sp. LHS14.1]|nr:hypothetical protein NCS52_01593300 [Fusarium sp. LHS14.1]